MITIEPFQAEHIGCIDAQESQHGLLHDDHAAAVAQHDAWTVRLDGKIVACCGVVPIWNGRSMMWSQISTSIKSKGMVLLTKAVLRYLNLIQDRMEALVVENHEAGHRWIKLLGFTLDTPLPLKKILPNGENAYLYSRVI